MSLPINPETKVGALLDAYPGIDEVLAGWVPAFEKLKNPILRRTVAKVATLEQAARIGGIPVRELVEKLRAHTGQGRGALDVLAGPEAGCAHGDHSRVRAAMPAERPAWLVEARIEQSLDADEMLSLGEHPIGRVRQLTAGLSPGGIVKLTSSFLPAPLIDTIAAAGFAVYTEPAGPGRHASYFGRV